MTDSARLKKSSEVETSLSPVSHHAEGSAPDFFVSEILKATIQRELDLLPADLNEYFKRRNTLLAIAMSRVVGIAIPWDRPDICGQNTWYTKWQYDEQMQLRLQSLCSAMHRQLEEERLAVLEEAAGTLRAGAVLAARRLNEIVQSRDETEARLAAVSVLTHADKTTAPKVDDLAVHLPGMGDSFATVYGEEPAGALTDGEDTPTPVQSESDGD